MSCRRSLRLLGATTLVLAVVVSSRAGAEVEGHDTSPTLFDVTPRRHFEDDPQNREAWGRRLHAALEFSAMASALYRDDLPLFNARDGAIPYYVGSYLEGRDAAHWRLIALSPNTGAMDRPEASPYLRENGVTEATLDAGKRLVLLDGSIGWGRTLGRMRQELPVERRHELIAHSMMSFNEDYGPQSRSSLLPLWDGQGKGAQMPTIGEVDRMWEWGITFDVNAVEHYAPGANGRLVPQATKPSAEQRATGVQWKEHLRFLLDQPETRALFQARKALWQEAAHHLRTSDSATLLGWLDAQLDRHPGPSGEAFVRDVAAIALKHHRDRFAWDGLPRFAHFVDVLAGRHGQTSIRDALRDLRGDVHAGGGHLPPPPDGALVSHPHTGKVYLMQGGKKWWIPDPPTFERLGLDWGAIRAGEPHLLAKLPDAEHADPAALRRAPRRGAVRR